MRFNSDEHKLIGDTGASRGHTLASGSALPVRVNENA